jgi:hypothetical protein
LDGERGGKEAGEEAGEGEGKERKRKKKTEKEKEKDKANKGAEVPKIPIIYIYTRQYYYLIIIFNNKFCYFSSIYCVKARKIPENCQRSISIDLTLLMFNYVYTL